MKKLFKQLIEQTGEDTNRPGLLKTPERAAKSWEFLTEGYAQNLDDIVNEALFPANYDEMVIVKNIELFSLCEHHLLPFTGQAHIGYLPTKKVIGVSKIARIVDMFARRLQIQEQLTQQVAEALMSVTGATGVGVIIEAKHLCMMMRGVEKQHSEMVTSAMLGSFREDSKTRGEFLNLIR